MADFKLTPALEKELEKIAKSLPEKDFKDKYGKDWMQVKMATAMNILKKKHGYKTEGKMNFKELKEKYRSKFSSELVAKAVEIALSMGGNYTGAYKKIEALKKGLGDDPIVKGALRTANESFLRTFKDLSSSEQKKLLDLLNQASKSGDYSKFNQYAKKLRIHAESVIKDLDEVNESKASRLAIREKELNLKIKELKLRALMKAEEESGEEKKLEKKESKKTFKELRNELEEAKKAGRGNVTLDIDYIGDRSDIQQAERKYKIKIKMRGRQIADITGDKQNIYNFLKGPDYGMDELDIEEIFPELFESKIHEGRNEVIKSIENLINRGGMDKKDYQKALDLYKSGKYNDLRKHIYGLDTEPSETLGGVLNRYDSKTFNSMYPKAQAGDYIRSIIIKHGGK